MQVFVCTPPPHRMDFHSQWPPTLPWLQFWPQLQSLLTPISNFQKRCHQIVDTGSMLRIHDIVPTLKSPIRDEISSPHPSLLELASMVSMTMPELDEDENIRRAGALTGHPGPNALFEWLAIAMYHISNNLHGQLDDERWETIVTIFRHSGLMERPFSTLASHHTTMSAFLEKFYQAAVYKAVVYDNAGALDVIKWLLRSGQIPNTLVLPIFGSTMTAIEASIRSGRVDLLRLLLDHGADPNLESGRGLKLRPLEYALGPTYRDMSYDDHYDCPLPTRVEIARLLISKGAKVNLPVRGDWEPVLNLAIGLGDLDLVKMVIAHGADIRLGVELDPHLLYTITPLNRAAGFCDEFSVPPRKCHETALTLVRFIVELLKQRFPSSYKADITADTFIAAAAAGNHDVLTFLADLSPPASLTNPLGVTPLHGAAEHGCIQTCQVLLQLGCPLNSQSEYISPLHIACVFGHDEIVDVFIQNKAYLDTLVNLDGYSCDRHHISPLVSHNEQKVLCSRPMTPLEMAIYFCHNTCAVLLLLNEARVFGGELLLAAQQHPTIALLSALLDAGADPDERDGNGESVLRHLFEWVLQDDFCYEEDACDRYKEVVTMVDLLLSHRAKVDRADLVGGFRLGITSLSLALLRRHSRSAKKAESRTQLLEEAMLSGDTAVIEMVSQLHQDLPYSPVAVCTAVIARLEAKWIKSLLAVRSLHPGQSNIYEATAIGIAAHQQADMDSLRLLCSCLPPSRTCFMPVRDKWGVEGLKPFSFERNPRYWSLGTVIEVSPLTYPVLGHNDDAFNYLLEHDYKPDWTTWLAIAQENQTQMACALRKERFTVGKPKPGFRYGFWIDEYLFTQREGAYSGLTAGHPLNHAISHGNVDLVRMLLDAGSPINHSVRHEDRGRTALQFAIEVANLAIIHVLLNAGARVNAPPARRRGATALQMAAIKGLLGIAKLLLERRAKVNAPRAPEGGRTALEAAAEHGRIDMIDLLFWHGVETTGIARRQYIRSVKLAEAQGHAIAAKRIKDHRPWTEEDEQLLASPDILDEDTWWSDEEHYSDDDFGSESEEDDEDDDDDDDDDDEDDEGNGGDDDDDDDDNEVGSNDRDADDHGGDVDVDMVCEEEEMIDFDMCNPVEDGSLWAGNIDQNNQGVMNTARNGDTIENAITSPPHDGRSAGGEGAGFTQVDMGNYDPLWWERADDENGEDFERFDFTCQWA
ncbi:ankyrin repeat-containing domain protein [Chaetomium sp. MPI-CAGE-AT-0009]|nr:ankyrin repeat-containing domain protein [Chaetomium sp. MPI-CAGE-AT-0009]